MTGYRRDKFGEKPSPHSDKIWPRHRVKAGTEPRVNSTSRPQVRRRSVLHTTHSKFQRLELLRVPNSILEIDRQDIAITPRCCKLLEVRMCLTTGVVILHVFERAEHCLGHQRVALRTLVRQGTPGRNGEDVRSAVLMGAQIRFVTLRSDMETQTRPV